MRLTSRLLLLAGLLLAALPLAAAERLDLTAMLVTASREPGPSDPRLKSYEATLRRILRFESFRLQGQGRAALAVPGGGQISLGGGHQLQLEAEPGGGAARVQVEWREGGRSLMRTGLVLRPGVPAVLGGPGTGQSGEVFAVIVIAR